MTPALVINATFADNIKNDSQAATIENTINTIIAAYENTFSDNVTVDITFQEGGGLGGSSGGLIYYENYSDYRAALVSHATTADDTTAIASLPDQTNNPVNDTSTIGVRSPLARALGFDAPSAGGTAGDGTITLNTSICNPSRTGTQDPAKYDLMAVTAHEIDEILAGGSGLDGLINTDSTTGTKPEALDLYRYSSAGVRSYDATAATTSYFSIDGGTTNLVGFNQYAPDANDKNDFGDWYSNNGAGATVPRVQDSNSTPGATPNLDIELRRLDILGFTRMTTASPVVTPPAAQHAAQGVSTAFDLGSFTGTDGPWSVDVNWGDGSADTKFFVGSAGAIGTQSHTYATEGFYDPTVTVTDFTSHSGSNGFAVTAFTTSVALDGSNDLVIADAAASGKNDSLTLQSDTANGRYVIADPNHIFYSSVSGSTTSADGHTVYVPFASVSGVQVAVDTLAGNDALTVDYSLGNFAKQITYNGGTGTSDRLVLVNGTFTTEMETPTGGSSGSIVFGNDPAITYSNVHTITDITTVTGMATYNGIGTGGSIAIANGPLYGAIPTTGITSGNGAFATVDFADKTNVVVRDAGADTFDIDLLPATGQPQTLELDATGSAGDTFDIRATATTTNVLAAGTSVVDVGNAGSVQGILGTLDLENPLGSTAVLIDDSADTTVRSVTLSTLAAQPPSDSLHDGRPYGNIHGLAPAEINYKYGNTSSVTFVSGSGDTYSVQTTGTTTNIRGKGATTIDVGNAGSVQGILGTLNLENPGGGLADLNTIVVDDSADTAAAPTVTLSTLAAQPPSDSLHDGRPYGNIHGLAPAEINYKYGNTADVTIKGGVTSSGAGVTYLVRANRSGTGIIGGIGNDTFDIGSTANSLTDILAPIVIDGGANRSAPTVTGSATVGGRTVGRTLPVGDVVNVFDQGGPAGSTYTLAGGSAPYLERTGPIVTGGINLLGTESLVLNLSAGADTVNVGSTIDGTSTTINGNGNDTFDVTTTGANSLLTINATVGSHTVVSGTGAGSVLTANGNAGVDYLILNGTGSGSGVRFDGAGGDDVALVRATGTGSATQLLGGAGNDTFLLGSAGNSLSTLQGVVSADGGTGANGLFLEDQGEGSAQSYTLLNNRVDRTGAASVFYANLATLILQGTQGSDVFTVVSLNMNVTTTLEGNGGNDDFTVYVNALSGYNRFLVDGGLGVNYLTVTDATGGAVVHNRKSSPTSGTVTADYSVTPGALHSEIQYQNINVVTTNPSENASYIEALFHEIYLRNASRYELDYYTGLLQTQGRLAVVTALEHSPEGVTQTVLRYARELFGRPATAAEVQQGTTLLLEGYSEEEMLGAVFGDDAYFQGYTFRVFEIAAVYARLFRQPPPASVVNAYANGNASLLAIRELVETDDMFFYYGV